MLRWLLRVLGAVVVLAILLVALVLMLPAERIAALATGKFRELTGRELTIEGEVKPKFWPVLGVATGPVMIANADWATSGEPMLRAESLTIEINASALIGGDIRILGIRAESPRLVLERDKTGRENWVFGGGGSGGAISEDTPGVGKAWSLSEGRIEGGSIRFLDAGAGRDLRVDNVDLTLKVPEYDGPFTVDLSGRLSGQRLDVALEAGRFSAFEAGDPVDLTLKAVAGNASLAFTGKAGWRPLRAEGRLEADLRDLPALGALAGSQVTTPPKGLGAEELRLSGRFSMEGAERLVLSEASILADGNRMAGDLVLAMGDLPRPKLSGRLAAGPLALAGLTAGGEGAASSSGANAPAPRGWSQTPIDVSGLGAMDADLALSAEAIDLGRLKFGATVLALTIDRARAVFDIRQMAAYGGNVSGQFVINGRGGLSVGGKLTLANLQAQPLLQDLLGWKRLVTEGNLTLSFLGVGNSIDAIMKSLQGEGRLSLGKGELLGLDIVGMLRRLDTSYVGEGQKTIFDGVSGSFTMEKGNLRNSDLQVIAPYLRASGQGRIGLGPRDLDYSIRPTAFPGEDGTGGVMVPLRITGPWEDPTYRLDLEVVAREKMEAEAKAAEAKAKAELERKLEKELGVTRQDGESLEDAAKRRAEEALKKEAGKLFEGLLRGK